MGTLAAFAGRRRRDQPRAGTDPRLKQICNRLPADGASAKRDDLLRRVAEVVAAGEKALVFSQFVAEPFGVAMLARHLAPFRPLLLAGGMPAAAREAALATFGATPGGA